MHYPDGADSGTPGTPGGSVARFRSAHHLLGLSKCLADSVRNRSAIADRRRAILAGTAVHKLLEAKAGARAEGDGWACPTARPTSGSNAASPGRLELLARGAAEDGSGPPAGHAPMLEGAVHRLRGGRCLLRARRKAGPRDSAARPGRRPATGWSSAWWRIRRCGSGTRRCLIMRAFCSEFGLSPISRTRLSVEAPDDEEDDLMALLSQPRTNRRVFPEVG
jgi:hypothetical protein